MERKRELSSVDLAAIASDLNAFEGTIFDKAYLYPEGLLRLRGRHYDHGRTELLIQVGPLKHAHVADPEDVPDAPKRPPNFAKMLRNRISGAKLRAVYQHEFDRILVFEFERGEEKTVIIAELFGQGNIVVCDTTNTIVDSLSSVRLRSRTVVPGATYDFPESQVEPFSLSAEELATVMSRSDADVVRTLATQINLGGRWAEELCAQANIDGSLSVDEISSTAYERLASAIADLGSTLASQDFAPRIYRDDEVPVDVTPVAFTSYETLEAIQFNSFNDAVGSYIAEFAQHETGDDDAQDTDDGDGLTEAIKRQQRIIEQQEQAITGFDEQADNLRNKAESLYAEYDLVDEILTTVRNAREQGHTWEDIEKILQTAAIEGNVYAEAVSSIDGENRTVAIEIDGESIDLTVADGVEKNADRIYQEAKRVAGKKEGAQEAIADTRAELDRLQRKRAAPAEEEPAQEPAEPPASWTERESIPIRQSEEWYEQFRWFHTSDGFLVIGGRNADQNETLVQKYLEPGDYVFHAQAHGGPVTVLKATGPSEPSQPVDFPEATIDETAQFAVSYSSVWKAGQYAGDVYHVQADQVSKQPESGEYIQKGEFVVRGDREYHTNVPVGVAIGIACEPVTRVIGGPPSAISDDTATSVNIEPGNIAQGDVAKRMYRQFRESFTDTRFVRKIASPDRIQEFLPPGQSRIVD